MNYTEFWNHFAIQEHCKNCLINQIYLGVSIIFNVQVAATVFEFLREEKVK